MNEQLIIVLGILSIIAGILSVLVMLVQNFRIKKIKEEEYLDIWLLITQLRSILSKLNKFSDNDVDGAIAYEATLGLIRLSLKKAISLEKNFNEETIEKWIRLNKLPDDLWYRKEVNRYLKE